MPNLDNARKADDIGSVVAHFAAHQGLVSVY